MSTLEAALAQVEEMSEVNDRWSRQQLAEYVRPNMRCLEVGAGAGTMATWLAEQVTDGSVVATDIGSVKPIRGPRLVYHQHDLAHDVMDLLGEPFDLIYARAVLSSLLQPDKLVGKLVTALAPGGVLIVEEFTSSRGTVIDAPDLPRAERLFDAYQSMIHLASRIVTRMSGGGYDWGWGVHHLMGHLGLVEVRTTAGGISSWRGGEAGCRHIQTGAAKFRSNPVLRLVGWRKMRRLRELEPLLDDPRFVLAAGMRTFTAGRKPA